MMNMSNPVRIHLDAVTEEEIKKKYGYSSMVAFSTSFLEDYKRRILENADEKYRHDMSIKLEIINGVLIADLYKGGISHSSYSDMSIHIDNNLVEMTPDSFVVKPGCEYFETILVNEMFHAASIQPDNRHYVHGIVEEVTNKNGKTQRLKNVGLNEGISHFLAEKVTHRPIPEEIDGYAFNKKIVALLADVVGMDTIDAAFFKNGDLLKDALNRLAKNDKFFDTFSKKIDTITKMSNTIQKIKNGKLKVKDAASLEKMETVLRAQQDEVSELLFSKVVLPRIAEMPQENRQTELLRLLENNNDVLHCVGKYIPEIANSSGMVKITDETITDIQHDLNNHGVNFRTIQTLVNKDYKTQRKQEEVVDSVVAFYDENQEALEKEHAKELTPYLKRQLEKFVANLDIMEKAAEIAHNNCDTYREFIRKYFRNIPNLDEEIEKIRNEKSVQKESQHNDDKTKDETKNSDLSSDIMSKVRQAGADAAKRDAHKTREPEENKDKRDKVGLEKDFIIDNIYGEVIDQRNVSLYQKTFNIAIATGETIDFEDPVLVDARQKACQNYLASFKPTQDILSIYGDKWQNAIQSAFEEGYKAGMKMVLKEAVNSGLQQRVARQQAFEEGKDIGVSPKKVDIDELQFVYENFVLQTNDKNELEVINRENGQVIHSERTKNMVLFANEWVKATTKETAFSDQGKQMYSMLQAQALKNLKSEGNINQDELGINASVMGKSVESALGGLLSTPQNQKLVDQFFRMQTPDAKQYQPVPIVESTPDKTSHR